MRIDQIFPNRLFPNVAPYFKPSLDPATWLQLQNRQQKTLMRLVQGVKSTPLEAFKLAPGVYSTELPKYIRSTGGGMPASPTITIHDAETKQLIEAAVKYREIWLAQIQRCKNLNAIILQNRKLLEPVERAVFTEGPVSNETLNAYTQLRNSLESALAQKASCKALFDFSGDAFWQYHDMVKAKSAGSVDVNAMGFLADIEIFGNRYKDKFPLPARR